jgi:hypothetical protein
VIKVLKQIVYWFFIVFTIVLISFLAYMTIDEWHTVAIDNNSIQKKEGSCFKNSIVFMGFFSSSLSKWT